MNECMNDDCALVQIAKIMNLLEAFPGMDHEIGVIHTHLPSLPLDWH